MTTPGCPALERVRPDFWHREVNVTIPCGLGRTCQVDLGEHTILAPASLGVGAPIDPVAATRAALAAPLHYPPLASALVPGDRVTIALGRGVPQVASVLRGAIESLVEAGVQAADISVLSVEPLADETDLAPVLQELGVAFALHQPDNADALAMVGLTAKYEPLRLSRQLTDADFVLPISTSRPARRDGGPAKFGGLFPRFSSRETLDRFHGRSRMGKGHERRMAEADEAGWLLGVGMVVVVTPGPEGGATSVVAGEPAAASAQGARHFAEIWERSTDRAGDLVIAAVAGAAGQQTWANFARAVSAGEKVRAAEGALAICCELTEPPGDAFGALVDAMDYQQVVRSLRGNDAADAKQALILAQALARGPVYLRSALAPELVESYGMTAVESDAELSRLGAGRWHTIVIHDAQRLRPSLAGGEAS